MSDVGSQTYDYAVAVTPSNTIDDPKGAFSGLLVTVAGSLVCTPVGGPLATSSITIPVTVGQYIYFPVKRVWATSTATVLGLVSALYKQGA